MRIRFVLSHPAVPENVGAAARALVTCGFDELALVADEASEASGVHLEERARWLAVGAAEVLGSAKVYPTLAEAVAGADLVIGTTARHRSFLRPVVDSRALRAFLIEKGDPAMSLALVFGSEQNGLSNEELALCQLVTTIPIAAPYPSLNLAQAVMVFAYELAPLAGFGALAEATQLDPLAGVEGIASRERGEAGCAAPGQDMAPPEEAVPPGSVRSDAAPPRTVAAFMEEARFLLARAGIEPGEGVHRRLLEYFAHCNAYEIGALYTLFKRLRR